MLVVSAFRDAFEAIMLSLVIVVANVGAYVALFTDPTIYWMAILLLACATPRLGYLLRRLL